MNEPVFPPVDQASYLLKRNLVILLVRHRKRIRKTTANSEQPLAGETELAIVLQNVSQGEPLTTGLYQESSCEGSSGGCSVLA